MTMSMGMASSRARSVLAACGASACVLLALTACGDDGGPGTSAAGTSSSGGTSTGEGTSTGPAGSTSTAVVDDSGEGTTTTTDGSSGGSSSDGTSSGGDSTTGEPLCGPEDPGCGCDGIDVPDVEGLDENGDGIDGLRYCSVFVSALGGDDANDGLSLDAPVATLAAAIAISQGFDPPRPVLVAEGSYVGTVTVGNGTSLYGGYDASSWNHDLATNEVTVLGTEARALIADDIDAPTEIDGLTITAIDAAGPGESTYGIWVRNAPGGVLSFDHVVVVAGAAGAGEDGTAGATGANGAAGSPAGGGAGGAGGGSACGAVGGHGGAGNVCPSQSGQPGQAGGDPTGVGTGGSAGSSNCDGCFDEATAGGAGAPGSVGANGPAGMAPGDGAGAFSLNGLWLPPVGVDGGDGHNGGGGGGGGAGGFDSDPVGCDIALGEEPCSGGGGGGGSGGCGGDRGTLATAGGGSFALVVIDSEIQVTNAELLLGTGGDGGVGGDGGNGGSGGGFGLGAPPCACAICGEEPQPGAAGAGGGGGGGGAGGPGGCGGAVVGIASVGATTVDTSGVSFMGGAPGAAGAGGQGGVRADGFGTTAPDGPTGCAGLLADEQSYP